MAYLIECVKCGLTERNTIYMEVVALDKINRLKGDIDLLPCARMAFCMLYLCIKAATFKFLDGLVFVLKWVFWIK